MVETILSSRLFTEAILPFLLVFTVVFAILQKTEILGKGKKQIDAIVALVIGLIVITYGFAVGVISSLVPFLAVAAMTILVFMILYGMTFRNDQDDKFKIADPVKYVVGSLVAIGVVVTVLIATGGWGYLYELFSSSETSSTWLANGIFVVILIGAVAIVAFGGRGGGNDKGKGKKDE